eukprot:11507589-Alexandrium_andersonii.AAC.1
MGCHTCCSTAAPSLLPSCWARPSTPRPSGMRPRWPCWATTSSSWFGSPRKPTAEWSSNNGRPVSYTHLRAHETSAHL